MSQFICANCGDDIPDGWPAIFYPGQDGRLHAVHYFSNMCNEKGEADLDKLRELEALVDDRPEGEEVT